MTASWKLPHRGTLEFDFVVSLVRSSLPSVLPSFWKDTRRVNTENGDESIQSISDDLLGNEILSISIFFLGKLTLSRGVIAERE